MLNDKSRKRKILEEAINDYPTPGLDTATELLHELYKFIPPPITYYKLMAYSNSLDLFKQAWEAESIHSLLQLFDKIESETLEEIINMLD